jgi:lipid II:glycine glycyltransferase (peptidoglycan interpeptide bridge formation enzyme)
MQPFTGQPAEWNDLISTLPISHVLQTWEWAQVKSKYGWQPMPFVWKDAGDVRAAAMLLKRSLPIGGFSARLSVLYAPKGPLLDWNNAALRARVLDDLQAFARRQGAILLKIDPDVVLGTGVPGSEEAVEVTGGQAVLSDMNRLGWRFSAEQIQFRNSVLLDLSTSEDEMLARMKQKTRYNVRLAARKGVTVRSGTPDDFPMLYKMYAETSLRDGFVIRNEGYYRTVWESFTRSPEPHAEPLIAEVDGEPVAAIFLFHFAGRAYYIYGMSREAHREKMPNYLLQWEAMRRAKTAGCTIYDLWGAPDEFTENDSMWGVFRFKEGLGGEVVRTLGAWDYPSGGLWYALYTQVLPRVLDLLRSRGKSRTRREVSA